MAMAAEINIKFASLRCYHGICQLQIIKWLWPIYGQLQVARRNVLVWFLSVANYKMTLAHFRSAAGCLEKFFGAVFDHLLY